MQTKYPFIKFLLAGLYLLLLAPACNKKDQYDPVRLFRPVLKGDLVSDGNWIEVNWQSIKGAESYNIEISRDTFKTTLASVKVDTNMHRFDELAWDRLYQLRVKANAKDTALNSRWSNLGSIKTAKFPTIMNTPTINDLTDAAVRISWTTGGDPVSAIKILLWADSSIIKEVELTGDDLTNEQKIISGLNPGTQYIVYLYSGTKMRGWVDITTKATYSGSVIDLREVADIPFVLSDTIPKVPSGSTIILKRGATYRTRSVAFKSTTAIVSGDDLTVLEPATVFMEGSFDIASGSVIDSVVFNNIKFTSDDLDLNEYYAMNIGQPCTVGKVIFESCRAQYYRGFFRTKDNTMSIGSVLLNNCIISDIGNYGVVTVDHANSTVEKIIITNSTIFRVGDAAGVIRNTRNSLTQSIQLENCTFNEAPNYNRYLVEANGFNVLSGILIKNCIFGIGKASGSNTAVRGARAAAGTTITGSNNYSTADYTATSNPVPATTPSTLKSTELFTDPANGDFKIKDNTFPGKSTAGDPRWRP